MSNRTGIKTGAPAAAAAVRLALSYQVSHALYVATRLGIWDLLAAEVCTISEIASRAGTACSVHAAAAASLRVRSRAGFRRRQIRVDPRGRVPDFQFD